MPDRTRGIAVVLLALVACNPSPVVKPAGPAPSAGKDDSGLAPPVDGGTDGSPSALLDAGDAGDASDIPDAAPPDSGDFTLPVAGQCVDNAVDPLFGMADFGLFGINVPGNPPGDDVHDGSHWFVDGAALTQLRSGWARVGYGGSGASGLDPVYLAAFADLIRNYHAAGVKVMVLVTEALAGGQLPVPSKQLCVPAMADLWPRCSCDAACSNAAAWGVDAASGELVDPAGTASRFAERYGELVAQLGVLGDGSVDVSARPDAWELLN